MSDEIITGDCLEVMKGFATGAFDLVLTDPPYGLNFDYGDYFTDTVEHLRTLISKCIPEIMRVGKRVAILSGIYRAHMYPPPSWILCASWNTTGSRGYFGYTQWMPILVYGEDLKGVGMINGVLKSDCLRINGGGNVGFQRDKNEKLHLCPKPLEIMEWLVRRLSNEGDRILDPFLGSGTTGVAAIKLNRRFTGIEISPEYAHLAATRIKPHQEQMKLSQT